MPRPHRIFLSHAAADRAFTRRIATLLSNHGLSYWYSRSHLRGAQQWHDEIGQALRECDWFAVILSPSAVRSMWVKRECIYALEQRRFVDRILPILYRRCDYTRLSWTFSGFQLIDFEKGFDRGAADLLKTWRVRYR